MTELDELKSLATKVKEKKGRMDATQRRGGAQLLATILDNTEHDISETLRLVEDFQSDAVAEGIGDAWPTLSGERRSQVLRWLPAPQGERSQRRLALVAARISVRDGVTAIELLDTLLPDNRLGKELKQILVGTLFCDDQSLNFDMIANAASHRSAAKVLSKLAKVAFDATSGVELRVRYKLAVALITALRSRSDGTYAARDSLQQTVTEVERWPEGLRKQFDGWLRTNAAEMVNDFFPLNRQPVSAPALSPARDSTQSNGSFENTELTIDGYLQDRVRTLENELSALPQIRQVLTVTQERQRTESTEAKAREQRLSLQLRELDSAKSTLQHTLHEAEKRITDLQTKIQQIESDRETERAKLTQQITANANGRIGEFRQQVAMTLARHMLDLPPRDSEVTPELGRVLLLQFHQLIEVLAQLGIALPMRSGR